MRFVTGDFARLSAVIATQAKQWLDTGSNTWLDVTSPDNILVSGRLKNDAVVSSHVAAIPYAGSGYRMEIYGRDGTLVAAGEDSPQLNDVTLHGAQKGNNLASIAVPPELTVAASTTPAGEAFHVGQMYTAFARAIRGGAGSLPDFVTAVELHRLIDAIRQAADEQREVETSR
jgi:predicted dehydrogenase